MASHRAFEPFRSRTARLTMILGAAAAVVVLAAAPAMAAGHGNAAGHGKGFLVLNNQGVVTNLAPGQAVKQAAAACAGAADAVVVTVDDVRVAFPNAVQVCTVGGKAVTLTSQVAADADEVDAA
jgi:hypothetical protein